MVRRVVGLGLVVVLAVGLVGCASVDVATKLNDLKITEGGATPVAHINGYCWGLYFLPYVPLLAGDPSRPVSESAPESGGSVLFLQNSVRLEPVVEMVTRKAKALGATRITDLQSRRGSICLVLFWIRSYQVSGNAVK